MIADLAQMELNAQDIFPFMIHIKDVREPFLKILGIDFQKVGPLFDPNNIIDNLQVTCCKQVEANVKNVVEMLETEKDDWDSMQPPNRQKKSLATTLQFVSHSSR